jgi:rubrerythrin
LGNAHKAQLIRIVVTGPEGKGMAKIFICYRRDDTHHPAGRIYDRLITEFGKDSVFKDVDSIPIGVNFYRQLEREIRQCDIILVLVGDKWLATTRKRQEDERDYVRIEIELALKERRTLIPLVVGEKTMPLKRDLPSSIAEIAEWSGMAVRGDPYFHSDMDKLITDLRSIIAGLRQEDSHSTLDDEDNTEGWTEESNDLAVVSTANCSSFEDSSTLRNLQDAFAGESIANRRYLYFALRADVEGYNDTADIFRSTAEGETGHAFGHLEYLEAVGDPVTGLPIGATEDNLKAAISGETYEYTDMYPGMAKVAREEGFEEIAFWFEVLAKAERSHARKFQSLLDSLNS